MCRTWLIRRIVWTLDFIYIARKGEDSVIDSIPLAEADQIYVSESEQTGNIYNIYMTGAVDIAVMDFSAGGVAKDPTVDPIPLKSRMKAREDQRSPEKSSIIQIRTIAEGFNSGMDNRCLLC